MLRISIILATHNRAGLLACALESLRRQTIAAEECEFIVVDNKSTDRTAEVVRAAAERIPQLRYVVEERLGLSWARNAGLLASRGLYVAYLDDDARAEPGWAEAIVSVFERSSPPAGCVGGRILLDWSGQNPNSVPQRHWTLLSYLDYGEANRPLMEHEYIVGANMAFRRDVLLRFGGFSTQLGRRGLKSVIRRRGATGSPPEKTEHTGLVLG